VALRDVPEVVRLMRLRGTPSHVLREIRVKPLAASCWLRTGTTDVLVLRETFNGQYHLPPEEASNPATILDLGSNIGLTVAHYAVTYPEAVIVGIEMDPEAATLASRNVARWGDRCSIVSGAVSTHAGVGSFDREAGDEWGFKLSRPHTGSISVETYSVGDLVARLGGAVDFLKMDVEGTEAELLAEATEWTQSVKAISVEIHPPAEIDWCEDRLTQLGFSVRRSDRHPALVFGVRAAATESPSTSGDFRSAPLNR
jgi:FkbM family methyltransferase